MSRKLQWTKYMAGMEGENNVNDILKGRAMEDKGVRKMLKLR
jgi:hypothetical protein